MHLLPTWRIVARHDWRVLRRSPSVWMICLLLAAASAYGAWNGVRWAAFQRTAVATGERSADEKRERLRGELAAWSPESGKPAPLGRRYWIVGGYGAFVGLPPAPLTALSIGQSDIAPYYTSVSVWPIERQGDNLHEIENPLHQLSGRLDLGFVIVWLLPLTLIGVAYDILAGERERGILPLLLTQGATLGALLAGKSIVRGSVVLGALFVPALIMILPSSAVLTDPRVVAGLALWMLVVVLYAAFWLGAIAFVNTIVETGAGAALALASTWLSLVVVIPAVLNVALAVVYPVPSRVRLEIASREAANEAEQNASRVLQDYYHDHPELLPEGAEPNLNDFATKVYAVHQAIEARVQPLTARLDAQVVRQQEALAWARLLTPALAAQETLNDVAGTGLARQRAFRAQAARFRETWRSHFMPKEFKKERMRPEDYALVPRFTFQEQPFRAIAMRAAAGLLGLALMTLLAFILAARRVARATM